MLGMRGAQVHGKEFQSQSLVRHNSMPELTAGKLLSIREHEAWEKLKPPARVKKKFMLLTRTIMMNVKKIAWKPAERPSEKEIQEFVFRTNGAHGKVGDGKCFYVNADSKSERGRASCGEFRWKTGDTGAQAAQYVIADLEMKERREMKRDISREMMRDNSIPDTSKDSIPDTPAGYSPRASTNIHMLKFFAIHKWGLNRPEIILSITGGAKAFDLNSDEKDKILKGMMEGTRGLLPWIVTGGTHTGIMKYVGEARARYNPTVPLIGIAPLGILKGARRFRSSETHSQNAELSDTYEKISQDDKSGLALLDENHSHFILTDDGTEFGEECFGKETKLRADFESCIAANFPAHHMLDEEGQLVSTIRPYQSGSPSREMEEHIMGVLMSKEIGWNRMRWEKADAKVNFGSVPLVSICVQGGPGTVGTVMEATLNGTPALVVRGSGKAADLIADCTLMRYAASHECFVGAPHRDHRQRRLHEFLSCHGGLRTGEGDDEHGVRDSDVVRNSQSEDDNCYNFAGKPTWALAVRLLGLLWCR